MTHEAVSILATCIRNIRDFTNCGLTCVNLSSFEISIHEVFQKKTFLYVTPLTKILGHNLSSNSIYVFKIILTQDRDSTAFSQFKQNKTSMKIVVSHKE